MKSWTCISETDAMGSVFSQNRLGCVKIIMILAVILAIVYFSTGDISSLIHGIKRIFNLVGR